MRSTFRVLFYLKRNAPKKGGVVPIMGRITINGTIAQFSTKLDVLPCVWDVRSGRLGGRSLEVQQKNIILDKIRIQINQHYQKLSEQNEHITAIKVKNALFHTDNQEETLLRIFARHNENFAKQVGYNRSRGTYNKYCQVYNHVAKFIRQQYRKTDILLKELDYQFILNFDLYLRRTVGCNPTTVWVYMMPLKRMVTVARNHGWLTHNPFSGYKAIPEMATRGYLSDEEIGILLKAEFKKKQYEVVRDLFIFSCFTGLSYTDIKNLNYNNLQRSFDGHLWIITKRQKTNTSSNIRLLEIPYKIIKKYQTPFFDQNLFPIPGNSTCNYILKQIARQCDLKTYLTFHVARHTFATTVTLSQGVPIETVSKILGHKSIKTTQIYAQITNQKISQDMELLARRLKKLKYLTD